MYRQGSGFIVAFMQAGILKIYPLTSQCSVNKHGFAVNAGYATSIVR